MRPSKFSAALGVLLLFGAACAGGETGETTTTTTATTTPTTAATTSTTVPPTTTTQPADDPTTTTTTQPADTGALAIVEAKLTAAQAQAPEGWTSSIEYGETVDPADDDTGNIFSACAPSDGFDVSRLPDITAAAGSLDVSEPLTADSLGASFAGIEARVFESAGDAQEAFSLMETLLGTDEGRECMAQTLFAEMAAEMPADTEFDFAVEPATVSGADVAVRVVMSFDIEGFTGSFSFDMAAARDGECVVFGTFLSTLEPFPDDLKNALFSAAASG